MNLKTSPLSIQDNIKDLDNSSINHPTLDDLMREQNVSSKHPNMVHHRRDLDSLG